MEQSKIIDTLETYQEAMRQGRAYPLGVPSTLVGPSWLHRPTSSSYIYLRTLKTSRSTTKSYFFLLYISMYLENIEEHHENLIPPPQPYVPKRSHLGAFSGAPPEGALITEGLYINSMAPPMMCE